MKRRSDNTQPIFVSLTVCRQCDKPLSVAEHIENFCESCNRPFIAEEVNIDGEHGDAALFAGAAV